ncbi:MAG TPA: translation elongation factor Ts [Caulobacteraceae bacterium]|jgi:elongation factor Ts|nr:translation elongation factor Ts [Caulobacteraceae bacterium]
MAEITASLVKALREKSGVGMMDCKKALQETGGDMEAAVDWLRAKGLAKAAKKADRIAAEGVVALATRQDGAGMTGALVELNAETDFVARNDAFQALARKIAAVALDVEGGIDALRQASLGEGQSVGEGVTHLIATIGENLVLRRSARFAVKAGAVGAYVHGALTGAPDLGRIGVLVAVEGDGDQATLRDLGREVALHVAAASPLSLSVEDLEPAAVEREKAIFTEQAIASGKPPAVAEKMVHGRLRKFYEEAVLLKQAYVRNPDQTIEKLVAETAKATGSSVQVTGFSRLALGEGIEKESGDFAGEVAALTGAEA